MMKNIISALFIATMLVSCNSGDKKEDAKVNTAEAETEIVVTGTEATSIDYKEINTDEALIATAIMSAPEASRANCTVIGYNMAGEFVTLKEGSNEFIVLADDPTRDGFSAACYHKDLEPFMARGRELKAEKRTGKEIFDIREEEIKSGKLKMGPAGSTLHIYFGGKSRYNPETSEVEGAQYRYVVYMPFATAESTGLPAQPIAPNHPWIMNPGTHRAHIMISPVAEIKKEK